jgi:hypothetical protein
MLRTSTSAWRNETVSVGRRPMSSESIAPDSRLSTYGMRLAGLASIASAAIAAIAVVLLFAMYLAFGLGATSAGQTIGGINDVLTLVAYLLAVPGILATAALLRSRRPRLVVLGAIVALAAICVIVGLQWQLVNGALTLEQQIGPVSVAFLALGSWFVLSAYLGEGLLPYGVGTGVVAALYVGYPLLAFRLGRSLWGRIR